MAFWQEDPYNMKISDIFDANDHLGAMRMVKEIRVVAQNPASGITEANLSDYHALEAQLLAVAMHHLSEQMLLDLFETKTVYVLQAPESVDLINNLKITLMNKMFIEDRNILRGKIRDALLRCEQAIGTVRLVLGKDTVDQSVQNWLKLYVSEVGNEKVTGIKLARFFSQNKDVQRLSPTDRVILRRLIDIFEFLKRPSEDMVAYEEDMVIEDESGKLFELVDGRMKPFYTRDDFEDFKIRARNHQLDRSLLWSLMAEYPDEFKEFAKFKLVDDNTSVKSLDPVSFATTFAAFIQSQRSKFAHRVVASGVPLPNRTAALVAMLHKSMLAGKESDMILAKEILQFTFSDQERLANFMRHISVLKLVQDDFPAEIGEKNRDVVRQSPVSPMAMQALLMIIFGKKFGLSPEETAWQSFEVISKLPSAANELKTVVTYNPSQDKLVWRYEATE